MNDILDIAKATGAGTVGIGTWYVEVISQLLQMGISSACLIYLVAKVIYLIKNKGR